LLLLPVQPGCSAPCLFPPSSPRLRFFVSPLGPCFSPFRFRSTLLLRLICFAGVCPCVLADSFGRRSASVWVWRGGASRVWSTCLAYGLLFLRRFDSTSPVFSFRSSFRLLSVWVAGFFSDREAELVMPSCAKDQGG
jgi:hypothetical protein